MNLKLAAAVLVVVLGVFARTGVATAEPAAADTAAPDPDAWRFQAASYGWLMSVSGSTTSHGQTVDTNAIFIDLLQKSDSPIVFMGYLEAHRGPVGVYADFVFTKMGFTTSQIAYRNPLARPEAQRHGQRGAHDADVHRRAGQRVRTRAPGRRRRRRDEARGGGRLSATGTSTS